MLSYVLLLTNKKTNMLPLLKNPLTLAIVLSTSLGILTHDTQLDKAAVLAVAVPATFSALYMADAFSHSSDHVHVERASADNKGAARMGFPKTQTRDDDHKYVQEKKSNYNGGNGDDYILWPSV